MADQQHIPDDALGRIFEAIKRSPRFLPSAAGAQLEQLLKPETMWALAIIFGLWAGLQLLPAGPLVDSILALAGGYVLLQVFGSLKTAVRAAADAKTSEQLDKAAKLLAGVWVEIGIDVLTGLAASRAFRLLEGQILRIRPFLRGAPKPGPVPEPPRPARPAAPEPAPKVPESGAGPRPVEPAPPPAEPAPPPREPVPEAPRARPATEPEPTPGPEVPPGETALTRPKARPGSPEALALRSGRWRAGLTAVAGVEVAPAAGEAGKNALNKALSVGTWILVGTGVVVLGAGAVVAMSRRRPG